MILPQDAPALTPAERLLVQSWTDEERRHVHTVLPFDMDIRDVIAYINSRRGLLGASAEAAQEKYGVQIDVDDE